MVQSMQAQILEEIIKLGKGQATIVERVDNMDEKLNKHLEECNQRPKDDNGKPIERRNGLYRWKKRIPIIALIISILTFMGGWQACEYAEEKIHQMFEDYSKHLDKSE